MRPYTGLAKIRSPSIGHLPLPLSLFYFSIETLATVGYGDMHPQSNYGHLIATVEIFTGMSFLAVMTGLIFARFSRPRARFVFARHPIITTYQGMPALLIRIANARHNAISQATAQLWLFRLERTKEGEECGAITNSSSIAAASDVLIELDAHPRDRRDQPVLSA